MAWDQNLSLVSTIGLALRFEKVYNGKWVCIEIDKKKIDPMIETRLGTNFGPKPLRS
jgi:hypothetical protein